jgi:hypothetical protein
MLRAVRPTRAILGPAALGVLSGVIGLAMALWAPPGPDLPAHLYQIAQFRSLGFRAWDNLWYGGSYTQVGYSLLFAPVSALFGVAATMAASAALASAAFADLVRRRWPDHWRPAAVAFALLAPTPILYGQLPFMLGTGFGLAALWALEARRRALALALLVLCSASSPLALLFVLLPLAAAGLTSARVWRDGRMLLVALGVCAVALAQLMVQLVFARAGARYPRGVPETLEIALLCAAGVALCWRLPGHRVMGWTFAAYALAGALFLAVPSTVGANAGRLAIYMGAPLLLVPMAARRFRPHLAVLPLLGLVVAWQGSALVYRGLADAATASVADRSFWAPAAAFLARHGDPAHRVEVVATAGKWESYRLPALGVPLARGWFRQDDWPQNAPLYGPLTRRSYIAWLRDMGVRYVLLPDTHRDASARAEALLVHRGHVLPEVARLPHWTVYALPHATPIATPRDGAQVVALDAESVAVRVRRAGTYRLRLTFTPYWTASGPACVAARQPWGTLLRARAPGLVVLRFELSAEGVLDSLRGDDGCPPSAPSAGGV